MQSKRCWIYSEVPLEHPAAVLKDKIHILILPNLPIYFKYYRSKTAVF